MLREASLTTRALKPFPRRYNHAYSSFSSTSNHEPSTTPTHHDAFQGTELSSGELGTDEVMSHNTMSRIGAGLSSLSNNRDQVLYELLLCSINVGIFDSVGYPGVVPKRAVTKLARRYLGHTAA